MNNWISLPSGVMLELGCSRTEAFQLCKDGTLNAVYKSPRRRCVHRDELTALREAREASLAQQLIERQDELQQLHNLEAEAFLLEAKYD